MLHVVRLVALCCVFSYTFWFSSRDYAAQGISSDPPKMAVFRALQRARTACLAEGLCDFRDPVFRNASRFLIKPVEHTW